jgi:hypothetical protein
MKITFPNGIKKYEAFMTKEENYHLHFWLVLH